MIRVRAGAARNTSTAAASSSGYQQNLSPGTDAEWHLPKGSPEKLVLAWWLRENTTVMLRRVTERLGMGHYTRVTQAIRRMSRRPGRKQEKIKATGGQSNRVAAELL